jgi:hypothetical protein
MRASIALPFLAAAALAACNSYNPDLGAVPFRCGTDEPRCPLGYTCVSYSGDEELCEKTGSEGDGDGADAGPQPDGGGGFTCADDGELEPNNAIAEATNTFIPTQHDTYKLVSLSVCPDTDVDVFRFEVDVSGKNLRADLTYQAARGQLILEVLNEGAEVIRTGAAVPGMADLVRAEVPNMPQGTYFVQLRAPAGIENNYTIEIALSD